MGTASEHRIAENESVFREVNEAIKRGSWPGEEDNLGAFRCECARLDCNRLLQITPRDYESVRSNPRHFLVLPGHELPEERIVTRTDAYLVVEKVGDAGRLAEARDPRS